MNKSNCGASVKPTQKSTPKMNMGGMMMKKPLGYSKGGMTTKSK
jgi:hypothetical protein